MCRPWLLVGLAVALAPVGAAGGERYALVVGVNEYDKPAAGFKPLSYAQSDATALKAALTKEELKDNKFKVTALTETALGTPAAQRPTLASIELALDDLVGTYDADKKAVRGGKARAGDTIVIALAGHGVRLPGDPNDYYCPQDAAVSKDGKEKANLLSLQSVVRRLEASPAAVRLLLVDACRIEIGGGGAAQDTLIAGPGVGVLLSCKAAEKSYESNDHRHGLFFYEVLQAFQGNVVGGSGEAITWEDVSRTVRKRVPVAAKTLGADQHPIDLTRGLTDPLEVFPQKRPNRLEFFWADFTARDAQRAWAAAIDKPVAEEIQIGDTASAARLQLVLVPPGVFDMGADQPAPPGKFPRVHITRPFYMGRAEVTQKQFRVLNAKHQNAFAPGGTEAAKVKGLGTTDDLPADSVTYTEATEYCENLTKILKRESRWEGYVCRLPTEAEWEYACRAGTQTRFAFGDRCEVWNANCYVGRESLNRPNRVGSYAPNRFGLADMHGNVAEWCYDWFDLFKVNKEGKEQDDPSGRGRPPRPPHRVFRGGCFSDDPEDCRTICRGEGADPAKTRSKAIGFRVVIGPPVKPPPEGDD